MMNKRRTKEIGRTKYLMFLPLAGILMIVSNIEMVARTTEKFAKEMMGQARYKRKGSNGNTNQECTGFSCLSGCRRNAGFSGRDEGIDGLLV